MKRFSFARIFCRVAASSLVVAATLPSLALADVSEEFKLAPPGVALARAGTASSIFGDTAVVGAPGETTNCAGGGAAYVFTRTPPATTWQLKATLCASDGVAGDQFGASVSINNGNIAVGAPGRTAGTGAVYVYSGADTVWTENATILSDGAVAGGALGSSVSIQGFTVAAGAPHSAAGNKLDTGITIVYTSSNGGTDWTNTTFRPSGGQARAGSLFGTAVSLSGSTILVGAPGFRTGTKLNSGAVFVFVNSGSIWTQQARIRPANNANVFTGASVSLFQDTGAFGAPGANSGQGIVYVYNRSGTTWTQQDSVTTGASGDGLGTSVSVQGSPNTVLAAGAPLANGQGGRAYEFGSSGGAFSLLNELVPTDNTIGDSFGTSAQLDAGRIVVGAPLASTTQGAAYVFKIRSASETTITGIVNAGDLATDSLTGVPYDVFVSVVDPDNSDGLTTPTGSVHFDDSNGGSCDATLSEDTVGTAVGTCSLTSNFFGSLTLNASYGGDLNFAASSTSEQHKVTGNHFVFDPATPPNVLQGTQQTGVVVKLLNGADQLIDDSTTQVTVSIQDPCGDPLPIIIGTLTLTNGVADFGNLGPRFYTPITGLNYNAKQEPFDLNTSPSSATSGNFDVTSNAVADGGDILFADGFEDCRL